MVNPEVDNYVPIKERSPGIKEAILLEAMIQERCQKIPNSDTLQRDTAIQVMAILIRARDEIKGLRMTTPVSLSLGQDIGRQLRREIRRSPPGIGDCSVRSAPKQPSPYDCSVHRT